MKSFLIIVASFAFALCAGKAFAQQAQPNSTIAQVTGASIDASGTIAVTNTFQSLFAALQNRKSCTIQNNGTNKMYIGVGSSPTLTNSFQVPAGATFVCATMGVTVNDAIAITGTAGDAFVAKRQ